MSAQPSTKQSYAPESKSGVKSEAKDDLKSLPLPEVEKNWGRRRIYAFIT